MIPNFSNKITDVQRVTQPSKTYAWNLETGTVTGSVDGKAAMLQAINKILLTTRYSSVIYSGNYGNELVSLIGNDFDFVEVEVKRKIREALLADDRITAVDSFIINQLDGNSLDIQFTATTVHGEINMEVEVTV